MQVICPTSQIEERVTNAVREFASDVGNSRRTHNKARDQCPARAFFDNVDVHLICPTSQQRFFG
jgi:hypothetical protein